jgi:hypothetical protein
MASVTVSRLSSRKGKEAEDWDAVYDLCCRTGNNGEPVAPERWGFFGRLWVGPYEAIFPQWTYVAKAEKAVVGYLTGCPDSCGFAKAKLWRFGMPLLIDICCRHYSENRPIAATSHALAVFSHPFRVAGSVRIASVNGCSDGLNGGRQQSILSCRVHLKLS